MIDENKKQLIVDGWNGGLTGGELAALHGVTRNSIMGTLSRARDKGLKVQERSISQTARAIVSRKGGLVKGRPSQLPDTRRNKPEPGMPLIGHIPKDTERKLQRMRNLPKPIIIAPEVLALPADGLWVGFMDLQNNAGCRYSEDAKLFCNRPGFPYCPEHKAIVNPVSAQVSWKRRQKFAGRWL